MSYIISFPVLAIVIAVYLMTAAGGGMLLDGDAYSMTLASGAEMTLRGGDFFIIAGLVALFLEMLKAARPGRSTVLDHILSTARLRRWRWSASCWWTSPEPPPSSSSP